MLIQKPQEVSEPDLERLELKPRDLVMRLEQDPRKKQTDPYTITGS